jgi:FixJ family two-component response regulator
MEAAEICILVVDDEEIAARALGAVLRGPQRKIIVCTEPGKVPALMAAQRIDVIISDEQMPDLNGVRLLAMLRETHPETLRVLLTGSGSVEVAAEAINEAGVFKFLTKPCRKDQLDAVVQAAQRAQELRKPAAPLAPGQRRRAILEELEREHPGIVHAPAGVYLLRDSAITEALELLVQRALEGPVDDAARERAERHVMDSDPVALVDALAFSMILHPELSVAIEPSSSGHVLSMEAGSTVRPLLVLPRGLGDTVAARLAMLGELDVSTMGEQLGRRTFKLGVEAAELLITFRTSSAGLACELRRVETSGSEVLALDPGLPKSGMIGPYRVLDILGHGGLGVVYRAVHQVLERPVAIKVLHAPAHDTTSTARFLREARAASRARHPGIVDILEFGRCLDGRPYLVMEIVEAPTLEQRLGGGALPLDEAVPIAQSIASALGAAHEAGVVHRDLKPSNIFVDEDLNAKISDFGAAKMVGVGVPTLTQEGIAVGTPCYMSPEQARGLAVDRRSDLYALGCVLYEMVVGARPFDGATTLDVLSQHIGAPVPVPVSPHEPVPHALARVIRRALAKSPAERHQTAAETIADLAQAGLSLGRVGWRRWLP